MSENMNNSEDSNVTEISAKKTSKTKEKISLLEKAFNSTEELVKDYFDHIPKATFSLDASGVEFDLSNSYEKKNSEFKKINVRANNSPKLTYKIAWKMADESSLEVRLISIAKNGETEISKETVEDAKKVDSVMKSMITTALSECAIRIKDYLTSNAHKIAKVLSGDDCDASEIEGVWTLPEEIYRLIDALNNSNLKYLDKSYNHFEVDRSEQKKTKSMGFGSVTHLKALEEEKYRERIVVTEVLGKNTNEGKKQALINDIVLAGKEVISPEVEREVDSACEKLKSHPLAGALIAESKFEQVYIWLQDVELPATNGKPARTVHELLKAKVDGEITQPSEKLAEVLAKYLRMYSEEEILNSVIIWEFKTTNDASDLNFNKTYENFDYDIQGAQYSLGARKIYGKPVIFLIVAVEDSAPYEVNVFPVNPLDIESSEDVIFNRLQRYVIHRENSQIWRGYPLTKEEFLTRRSFAQSKNLDRASRKIE